MEEVAHDPSEFRMRREGPRLQPWAGDPRLGAVGHRPGQRPHWSALPCIYLTEIGHCVEQYSALGFRISLEDLLLPWYNLTLG